jgi:UDP-galactopyranose mutase
MKNIRDDRDLVEEFQALPAAGYPRMFERMVAAVADKLGLLLNTDYRKALSSICFRHMTYTGPSTHFF